nr:MAG TPA: hypothetical protein [Caudoviricetes sp.]
MINKESYGNIHIQKRKGVKAMKKIVDLIKKYGFYHVGS